MAEKIVILGNGFDLRHFLPTKYDHLITILKVIENINFGNEVETDFDELFGNLFKEKDKWFFEKINEYYETKNIYFETVNLKSIQERLKTNKWFQYLKSVEDNKIETWIDFEAEINRVLKIVIDFFEKFDDKKNILHQNKRQFGSFILQNNNYNSFFKNNLEKDTLINFLLFELMNKRSFLEINEKYFLIIEDRIQYLKEKYFFDFIYKSLEEFTGIFNDYIVFIVNKFYRHFKEEKKENFIYSNEKLLFDNISKIFSFNYTNTFKELYNIKDEDRKIKRTLSLLIADKKIANQRLVHGGAISDWDNNLENLNIVLGVDEINSSLKRHKLFQFTKYFQKLHKNTDYLFLDDIIKSIETPITKDENEYIFYFWGHSLDISDRDYINDVIKILLSKEENKMIIFYHSIDSKANLLINLLALIEDKNIIENLMKREKLQFIESTFDNLCSELV